ncbi:MAG: hypothetical protein ACO29W_18765, partial [Burkholderiaceae bacterium]
MARYLEGLEGAQAPLPVHSDPLGREFDTRLLLGPVSNDAGSARRQPISFLPYVSRLAVRLHADLHAALEFNLEDIDKRVLRH